MAVKRGRAYTRYQRNRHINRKKYIIHKQNDYWFYKYDGMLSKGKIHCSCWFCRLKLSEYISKCDKSRIIAVNDYNFTWENYFIVVQGSYAREETNLNSDIAIELCIN